MQITLYTKPDCCLCDNLKADLGALFQERTFAGRQLEIREVNIESSRELQEKFRYLIPVLELPDATLHYPPHDYMELRRALLAVAQKSPTSTSRPWARRP